MNITVRKLALLEKKILEQELIEIIDSSVSNPIDKATRKSIKELMHKIRSI